MLSSKPGLRARQAHKRVGCVQQQSHQQQQWQHRHRWKEGRSGKSSSSSGAGNSASSRDCIASMSGHTQNCL